MGEDCRWWLLVRGAQGRSCSLLQMETGAESPTAQDHGLRQEDKEVFGVKDVLHSKGVIGVHSGVSEAQIWSLDTLLDEFISASD